MKELHLSDFENNLMDIKEKRNAYTDVCDFINSRRCYKGEVCILYGLRRTGKTTIMQQAAVDTGDDNSCLFLETTSDDTMDKLYDRLDQAVKDGVKYVFIDEITAVPDFIDESALLADIYAKQGLRIVLSGTDSLSFVFAENHSLFGRATSISTTYIPFEEHCRVLNTKDMDDYISYGGLMAKGVTKKEDRFVYDYKSACRYLNDAVSGNISRSIHNLAKYANHTALYDVSEEEMTAVLEKMVEKYSGVLNTTLANEELKKIALSFPTDRQEFLELEGAEIFQYLRANKPEIVKEFAKEINADTTITHKFTEDMINRLEDELTDLGFVSVIKHQGFVYNKNSGWNSLAVDKEYYLIQPAIKYYHLQKALEFVESNPHYQSLSGEGRQFIADKLTSKIKGDMTEQIVVFEVANALPSEKYSVYKTSFRNQDLNSMLGEYDMLVYDKSANSYYAFEIKHTSEPSSEQYKHLMNENFMEIIDYMYGNKENVAVLYNGKPFKVSNGVVYLNIADFVKEIAYNKDFKEVMYNLCKDLEIRDLDEGASQPAKRKFDKTDD